MALKEDLRMLADNSIAALNDSHDYHAFTKRVWRFMGDSVKEGREFTFRNAATNTELDERGLLKKRRVYLAKYLTSGSFLHFVSLFEDFFFDLLSLWLTAYPGSLSRKQLDLGTVLRAADNDTIVRSVVEKELNELKYERVTDWFPHLDRLVKLGCPSADEIGRLAEIKASRDILVHNRGAVNATYVGPDIGKGNGWRFLSPTTARAGN